MKPQSAPGSIFYVPLPSTAEVMKSPGTESQQQSSSSLELEQRRRIEDFEASLEDGISFISSSIETLGEGEEEEEVGSFNDSTLVKVVSMPYRDHRVNIYKKSIWSLKSAI